MLSVIKSSLSNAIALAFYNSILYNNDSYYVAYGKGTVWDATDTILQQPIDNSYSDNNFRNDMILMKRITSSDIAFSIPNNKWNQGTIYDIYDDQISANYPAHSGATSLQTAQFFVITTEFNVYKCLYNNNNSPSVIQPFGTNYFETVYNDGYVWKYMYSVPVALRGKFITPSTIPVITSVSEQFYSSGQILNATVTSGGSGYTTASIQVQGNGTAYNNPYTLSSITITNAGSGYSSAPIATVSSPLSNLQGTVQATATTTINASGQVVSGTFTNVGHGYDNSAIVTLSAPVSGSIPWTSNTNVNVGQVLFTGTNYYTVTVAGTTGTIAPFATTSSIVDGTATIRFSGSQAFASIVSYPNPAQLTPVISNGSIIGIQIVDGGIGYSYANLIINGNGVGAFAQSSLSVGDLSTNQAIVELNAVKGSLSAIIVTNGGTNYIFPPTVTINGDGTGATATAIVQNNQVTAINITNYGQGYTYATATISGYGNSATARVILAPYSGHGSNAINELAASTLNIYLSIGNDLNYGQIPNNTYRKLGIIKNPKLYGSTQRCSYETASACYIMKGSGNIPTNFTTGTLLTQGSNSFLLVSASPTELLVQTSTNIPPVSNVPITMASDGSKQFIATSIQNPEIDKFSGELLIINASSSFTPSNVNQIVFNSILSI